MDSKIYQYYHYNKGVFNRCSALCIVPPKEEILKFVSDFITFQRDEIVLQFGYTIVHSLDNFCKKTGRDKALKNIEECSFKLKDIFKTENDLILITLQHETKFITLELKENRKSVYFIDFALNLY